MASVDVILPCLNEAAALPVVLAGLPGGYRPIVVDNGSVDGSAEVARDLGALVVSEPRLGYGAAVHTGLLTAEAEIVCVADADGEAELALGLGLPPLLNVGTLVASEPSSTSTVPAGSVPLALAVTLNAAAIASALPCEPAPYRTSVLVRDCALPMLPAL